MSAVETAEAEALAHAKRYNEVMGRLMQGVASPQDLQVAIAYQMKVNAELARELQQMRNRWEKPREQRPDDDQDVRPTPAMVEETLRHTASRARVGRAAVRSGYSLAEWDAYCERHGIDPTRSIKTERRGTEPDERQEKLPLEARSPSTTERKHKKPKPRRATG